MAEATSSTDRRRLELILRHRQVIKAELAKWDRAARPKQRRPPNARIWLIQTGRGWGKTRSAAEDLRRALLAGCRHFLAIGPTAADVHDVMVPMLLRVLADLSPTYRATADAPNIQAGGAMIHLRSGQRPDRCRGLEVGYCWGDEIDYWRTEQMRPMEALIAVIEPCVRIEPAQFTFTSTPRRGGLVSQISSRPDVVLTRGHSSENAANLAVGTVDALKAAYAGSWLERQELAGEVVEDVEGAIVTRAMLEAGRVTAAPELTRVVIGVDPSGGSDEQGIVAVGKGMDGHGYILADATACLSPDGWGRRVCELASRLGADRVVAERNYGGDMVESTLRTVDRSLPLRMVTATRGKHVRFEPVGALFEQGRLHIVGAMPELEDEVTGFSADGYQGVSSPNRADALVWAATDLLLIRGSAHPNDLYGAHGSLVT